MNPCMCKNLAYLQMNHDHILVISHTLIYPPPWMGLDLRSTFVLTLVVVATEVDPDYVVEDIE